MSESKHTPGPWNVQKTASLGPQYAVYACESGKDIAIVYNREDGHAEANANLLAIAPELVDVLRGLLWQWDNHQALMPMALLP